MTVNSQSVDKSGFSFLLLSGGVGQRSGHHEPKQFYELSGSPMIVYSLTAAVKNPRIKEVITNAPPGFEEKTDNIMKRYCNTKPYKIVNPGETRQESCYNLVKAATCKNVIIHEAARPLVDSKMYERLIESQSANAGFCYPIPFSMCKVDSKSNKVVQGVPREDVYDVQLPQKFERDTLILAHENALKNEREFTEDSIMVIEMTDADFFSITGTSRNKKVTSFEDFLLAEKILSTL